MACNAVATARVKAARLSVEQALAAVAQIGDIKRVIDETLFHGGKISPYVGFVMEGKTVFYDPATGDIQVQIPGGFQSETKAWAEQVKNAFNNRAKLLVVAALQQSAKVTGGQAAGNATVLTLKV